MLTSCIHKLHVKEKGPQDLRENKTVGGGAALLNLCNLLNIHVCACVALQALSLRACPGYANTQGTSMGVYQELHKKFSWMLFGQHFTFKMFCGERAQRSKCQFRQGFCSHVGDCSTTAVS